MVLCVSLFQQIRVINLKLNEMKNQDNEKRTMVITDKGNYSVKGWITENRAEKIADKYNAFLKDIMCYYEGEIHTVTNYTKI